MEHVILPKVGLDPFQVENYPSNLHKFCGLGFMSCQMPNQLAKYLAFLSTRSIQSYLEIGVAMGGTFVVTLEYLRRFNPEVFGMAIDMNPPSEHMQWYADAGGEFEYLVSNTEDVRVSHTLATRKWGLVLIDGDHSEEGCWRDYSLVKEHARTIAFHDISNDVCPGVNMVWNRLTSAFPSSHYREFTEQYADFIKASEHSKLMGLGVLLLQ